MVNVEVLHQIRVLAPVGEVDALCVEAPLQAAVKPQGVVGGQLAHRHDGDGRHLGVVHPAVAPIEKGVVERLARGMGHLLPVMGQSCRPAVVQLLSIRSGSQTTHHHPYGDLVDLLHPLEHRSETPAP